MPFHDVLQAHFCGVDSTATRTNTSETVNALFEATKDDPDGTLVLGQRFYLAGTQKVQGLDLSGAKKSYLVAAQFLIEAWLFRWPKIFYELRSHLSNYDPFRDRTLATLKILYQLVAIMSMGIMGSGECSMLIRLRLLCYWIKTVLVIAHRLLACYARLLKYTLAEMPTGTEP